MSSITRKFKRKKNLKEKKDAKKAMATKVALFGELPDNCLTCEEPFDKTDKEMVTTWNVVVREKEDVVRLYCPTCWRKAVKILKDFEEHIKEKNEQ
jgi:hypothetical protein